MDKKPINKWVLALLVVLVAVGAFAPRWAGLDRFVTIDEWLWLYRSANFYYALGQREFDQTYQRYHPGVTTMWAGTAGLLAYFPEYRALGQGYFERDQRAFDEFVESQGKTQLAMLEAGRRFVVLGVSLALVLCFLLARRLVGTWGALAGVLLAAWDPFTLGHSRLLHIEGILSVLLVLAVLLILNYAQGRGWGYLLAAGAVGGLACLSKSSGIIILPFVGLVLVLEWWRGRAYGWGKLWGEVVRPFLVWLAVFAVVYVGLWPSMWTAPVSTLERVYGQVFFFVTEGDDMAPAENEKESQGYLKNLVWRSTPVTLLAAGLAVVWAVLAWRRGAQGGERLWLGYLALFVAVFLAMMVLGSGAGKAAPHYVLTVHIGLNMAAGAGLAGLAERAQEKWGQAWLVPVVLALFAGAQLGNALYESPYYLSYFNLGLGGAPVGVTEVGVGYGELLDEAGRYLASMPGAEETPVLSWYGDGSFSYFYPGRVWHLNPQGDWNADKIRRLDRSEYLVIYYTHQMKRDNPATLLAVLEGVEPVEVIWWHGVEYVRIYRVADLPESAFVPDP